MVHAAGATNSTVGPMLTLIIPIKAIGGATLKRQVFKANKKSGKHVRKTQIALGIDHVAVVSSTKAMKNHKEIFVRSKKVLHLTIDEEKD